MRRIPFTKIQGAGNDFLVIEGSEDLLPTARHKRRFCDRRFGVGADGVMFLSLAAEGADASVRLFNSDGGEAEISGNGTRCAAGYLVEKGWRGNLLQIRTGAGTKPLRLLVHEGQHFEFEMFMGAPILEPQGIPFQPPAPVPSAPITGFALPLLSGPLPVTVCSMGNPHCSLAVEDFECDWRALGEEIERHPYFPQRTNVEFYRALHTHKVEVRYWERGAGETLSSGTGSCAAAVAAILNHKAESPVAVLAPGGDLSVRWGPDGVYLTGPAEIVCHGEYFAAES